MPYLFPLNLKLESSYDDSPLKSGLLSGMQTPADVQREISRTLPKYGRRIDGL